MLDMSRQGAIHIIFDISVPILFLSTAFVIYHTDYNVIPS